MLITRHHSTAQVTLRDCLRSRADRAVLADIETPKYDNTNWGSLIPKTSKQGGLKYLKDYACDDAKTPVTMFMPPTVGNQGGTGNTDMGRKLECALRKAAQATCPNKCFHVVDTK